MALVSTWSDGEMPAYAINDFDAGEPCGVVLFAKSNIKARRRGASALNIDEIGGLSCCRAPWADEYEADGIVPAVNVPHNYASDTAHELLAVEPEAPFAACWFQRGDGKIQWSLRSEDIRMDVSEVARSMGGGGHRNAAGFEEVGFLVEGSLKEIGDELVGLFRRYARAENEKLTPAGRELKRRLLAVFEEKAS